MYGGGPNARRGGDAGSFIRGRAASSVAGDGSEAQATTAESACTGLILATATAARGRAASVMQQSLALPCGAHAISPSLQHAIAADVEIAASAQAAHTDQLKLVTMAKARTRTAARRSVIETDCSSLRRLTLRRRGGEPHAGRQHDRSRVGRVAGVLGPASIDGDGIANLHGDGHRSFGPTAEPSHHAKHQTQTVSSPSSTTRSAWRSPPV
jgi:hypothetical protein